VAEQVMLVETARVARWPCHLRDGNSEPLF